MTLVDFLLARIAEDEAIARCALHLDAVRPCVWQTEHHNSQYHAEPNRCHIAEDSSGHYWSVAHEVFIPNAEHMARHDPARVLLECEAKRRIVQECEPFGRLGDPDVLMYLALPYADHPDYDDAWRP